MRYWSERTELPVTRLVRWLGITRSKFHDWRARYGMANEHNALVPRDFWLEPWEREAILAFASEHPLEGYRRLTFMMIDADVVAVSSPTVYRVLKRAGRLRGRGRTRSKKGTGFNQPKAPHEHWHIDISYINVCGTFYYLCSLLDGYSRYLVHWELRESMTEREVAIIIQRGLEKFPGTHPRIISDNGPQFIAKDLKEFIRLVGMTHVHISPGYPQSNGKKERWFQTLKAEAIRPQTPLSLEDARRVVARFVEHYNAVRLHSAIAYVAPKDKLEGRAEAILAVRDARLAAARERRKANRLALNSEPLTSPKEMPMIHTAGQTDAGSAGEQPARDSRPGCCRKAAAGTASEVRPCAPLQPFGASPHAFENSDLPQASHSLTHRGQMSISR
jgi:putative transposase